MCETLHGKRSSLTSFFLPGLGDSVEVSIRCGWFVHQAARGRRQDVEAAAICVTGQRQVTGRRRQQQNRLQGQPPPGEQQPETHEKQRQQQTHDKRDD